jgi:hypothetical protein
MNRQHDSQQPTTGLFSRRAALGALAGTGLASALFATVGLASAHTQVSPTPEIPPGYEPNTFSLEGAGTHISYGTTSEDGQPVLTYRGDYPEKSFRGEEIRLEGNTALGPMVSVLLHADPDARVVYLTLLLPEFSQTFLGDPPFTFSTVAILTTHLTSIGGPVLVKGARQTYEAIALDGTATFVMS